LLGHGEFGEIEIIVNDETIADACRADCDCYIRKSAGYNVQGKETNSDTPLLENDHRALGQNTLQASQIGEQERRLRFGPSAGGSSEQDHRGSTEPILRKQRREIRVRGYDDPSFGAGSAKDGVVIGMLELDVAHMHRVVTLRAQVPRDKR
jgi:hypothetical protein